MMSIPPLYLTYRAHDFVFQGCSICTEQFEDNSPHLLRISRSLYIENTGKQQSDGLDSYQNHNNLLSTTGALLSKATPRDAN